VQALCPVNPAVHVPEPHEVQDVDPALAEYWFTPQAMHVPPDR
jgi:hypothetical protein